MKTEEELLKIIHDNEVIVEHKAQFISLDEDHDELIVELSVLLRSPKVNEEGEIVNPDYQRIRRALSLKLKLSDLFRMPMKGEPPIRDINYTMQKLEEALETNKTQQAYIMILEESLKGVCSHATGKHDEECDLVAGLSQRVKDFEDDYKLVMEERCGDDRLHCACVPSLRAAVKEAREEAFDLYHQACCVEISQDGTYARYDNMCMSTYESIEEKLIEWGLLKPEQCLRRPIKIDLLKDTEVKIPVSSAPVTPEWADEEKKK